MADPKSDKMNAEDHKRLESVALELFSSVISRGVHPSSYRKAGVQCFQAADEFLQTSAAIRDGGPITPQVPGGIQLDFASAPNLPKSHPQNLISQRFGSRERVQKVYDRIKGIELSNPQAETKIDDSELGINWDRPEIALAQTLFPQYCKN